MWLILAVAARMKYVYEAGEIKLKKNINTATDQGRADAVIRHQEIQGKKYGLPSQYINKIYTIIVNDSVQLEQKKMNIKLNKKK